MDGQMKDMTRKQLRRISQSEVLAVNASFGRKLIHMTGAWICRLRKPEVKYMMAGHLFQWAEHVDDLRGRLRELPGGKPDRKLSEAIKAVLHECMFASDEIQFLSGLYEVLIPALKQEYAEYIEKTGELPDRPSVHLVQGIIADLETQMTSGRVLIKEICSTTDCEDPEAWKKHIILLIQLAGGINGEDIDQVNSKRKYANHVYTFPEMQHRQAGSYYSYKHPIADYDWSQSLQGDPDIERAALGVWLYNELDACEYISTLLYEIEGMPWEFYYDVARHTWDEARHSEFGYTLLQKLGFDPLEFEVWAATYMSSMKLTPVERYTAVTCWYEPGSFQVKPDYLERVAEDVGGDDLVVELLKFDLADETLHVSFGNKWVQTLMDHYGVKESKKQFVEAVIQKGNRIREEQEGAFQSTMPKEMRHTMASIGKHMNDWAQARGSRKLHAK